MLCTSTACFTVATVDLLDPVSDFADFHSDFRVILKNDFVELLKLDSFQWQKMAFFLNFFRMMEGLHRFLTTSILHEEIYW